MSKPTTIKEGIKRWEEKTGETAIEATEISLIFQWPPIEKMDNHLGNLVECRKLSLSTNMIEKITGLTGMRNLKILSVGRNYIKSFAGLRERLIKLIDNFENGQSQDKSLLEKTSSVTLSCFIQLGIILINMYLQKDAVADTLEELWISYNFIEKLKGIDVLKKLRVLYMANNLVKEWSEFNKLQECPSLEDLLFVGNPLHDNNEESEWRLEVHKRLPNLKKLDGEPIILDQTF